MAKVLGMLEKEAVRVLDGGKEGGGGAGINDLAITPIE
jgi:hypothetical protein